MVRQPLLRAALLASLLAGCSASNDALDARLARDELALEQQIEALEERAREGDAAAAYELAARFYDGLGVEADHPRAARYYAQAADAGVAGAQFSLGVLHENGDGVISRREFVALIESLLHKNEVGFSSNIFKRFDANHDNVISRDELIDMIVELAL